MVLLWKGKVENQNQSLYESQNRPEQLKEKWWFRDIYDSWKDYDSLEDNRWLFKERLKMKDNHPKNWELLRIVNWFWMESWKLEDSLD